MILLLSVSYYSILLKTEVCPRQTDIDDCFCYFVFYVSQGLPWEVPNTLYKENENSGLVLAVVGCYKSLGSHKRDTGG